MHASPSLPAHLPFGFSPRSGQRPSRSERGRALPSVLAVTLVIASMAFSLLGTAPPTQAGPQIPPVFKVEDGTIRIRLYACPSLLTNSVSAHAAPAHQLLNPSYGCQSSSGRVTFVRGQSYEPFAIEQVSGSILSQGVIWDDVPLSPNALSIAEKIPAGWAAPRVFCDFRWSGSPRDPGLLSASSEMVVVDSVYGPHSLIAFALNPTQNHVHCAWYNIAA